MLTSKPENVFLFKTKQGFGLVFAELDETKLELLKKMETLSNDTVFAIKNSTAVINSNQNQIKLQIDQTAAEMQVCKRLLQACVSFSIIFAVNQ